MPRLPLHTFAGFDGERWRDSISSMPASRRLEICCRFPWALGLHDRAQRFILSFFAASSPRPHCRGRNLLPLRCFCVRDRMPRLMPLLLCTLFLYFHSSRRWVAFQGCRVEWLSYLFYSVFIVTNNARPRQAPTPNFLTDGEGAISDILPRHNDLRALIPHDTALGMWL